MKSCVICGNRIQSIYKLCKLCFRDFGAFTEEGWFKELTRMQGLQDRIDRLESGDIELHGAVDISGIGDKPEITVKKDVGRPKTDWRIIQRVLDIYDADRESIAQGNKSRPLSLRAIARQIDNAVGYFTVRSILIEYRPEYNKR